jgi:hypothetical protein
VQIAIEAFDAQSVAAQSWQMSLSGNEYDIIAGSGKFRAEVSAHRSCAHHRDSHVCPWRCSTVFSALADVNFTPVIKRRDLRFNCECVMKTLPWKKLIRSTII